MLFDWDIVILRYDCVLLGEYAVVVDSDYINFLTLLQARGKAGWARRGNCHTMS